MFTSFRRIRREVAVLLALSLVASVLVVAPAAAADPKADYTATFDACGSAPSANFTDVPDGHANAGDIDCIAYYGITKGTGDGSTYSPLMSVTREHMALFLMRLAGLVGIEVASNPSDPGFTDTGDLSAESQTAIAQLADLGITTGTSTTTYSPAANVKRGHMALFIQRLMDKMTPVGGASSSWGHTPSDVLADDKSTTATETYDIGSPFTDLGPATKNEYDAITELWELGVASGISDTSYAPTSDITRAAMAGFMAALLDHSNTRPSGISIQASQTSGFGAITSPTVLVSYRSDSFAPMADVAIQVFDLNQDQKFNDDGTCPSTVTNCDWSASSESTQSDGNFTVAGTTTVANGASRTFYAWMGDADNTKFDNDTANAVSVKIESKTDATAINVTDDINENNSGDGTQSSPEQVNLNDTQSVTFTVQLIAGTNDIAKPDEEITVGVTRTSGGNTIYQNSSEAKLKTDKDGKVTFTINRPAPDSANNAQQRTDQVTFDGPGDNVNKFVSWQETASASSSAIVTSAPKYVIRGANNAVGYRITAMHLDQYGKGMAVASDATASFDWSAGANVTGSDVGTDGRVSHYFTTTVSNDDLSTDHTVTVTVGTQQTPQASIEVVDTAANRASVTTAATVTHHFKDDNRFIIGNTVYTYDSGDTFLDMNKKVTLDEFEKALTTTEGSESTVLIPIYYTDGASVFQITN